MTCATCEDRAAGTIRFCADCPACLRALWRWLPAETRDGITVQLLGMHEGRQPFGAMEDKLRASAGMEPADRTPKRPKRSSSAVTLK
ncbi:MAG: hypothetical protein ACK52I_02370 [Pseudomonadota bacterium]|jgi:hypothetical protein